MQDFLMELKGTALPTPAQSTGGSYSAMSTMVYGVKLMIVRITVVVMSVVVVDDSSLGGGGGGSAAPGECNVPASAEIESVKVRATTAPVRSNLFT
jgi:hypothetical protein